MKNCNVITYDEKRSSFVGYYNHQLNLREFDQLVVDRLSPKQIKKLQSIAQGAMQQLTTAGSSQSFEDSLKYLTNSVRDLNDSPLERYLAGSREFIVQQEKLIKGTTEEQMTNIESYIRFLRKFIKLDLIYQAEKRGGACECNKGKLNDDGLYYCEECGRETTLLLGSASYIDERFIPVSATPTTKDRRSNFLRKIQKFEGKYRTNLPRGYKDKIKDYFGKRDSKWAPSTEFNIKDHLVMFEAIDAIGMNKFHDDINLITYECWGWRLPDLDRTRDQLMNDYDAVQPHINEYNRTHGEKTSDVNNDWRLWRHLHKLGLSYGSKRFRLPKTPDILRYYEDMWQWACDRLKWPKPEILRFL